MISLLSHAWKYGRLLVLDATYPDTFAPFTVLSTISEAGAVAAKEEKQRDIKICTTGPIPSPLHLCTYVCQAKQIVYSPYIQVIAIDTCR